MLDQDFSHFRTGHLRRRSDTLAQKSPDFRSRKQDPGILRMTAGFVGRHAPAKPAIIGGVKKDRDDTQIFEVELLQEVMRFKGSVIGTDARMVPAHDKMGTPVVFPDQGINSASRGPA
jgi:hypothetical protein